MQNSSEGGSERGDGSPEPGWYEDPQNPTFQRWWDGNDWQPPLDGDQIRPPNPVSKDGAARNGGTSRRTVVLVAVGITAAVLGIGAVVDARSGDPTPSTPPNLHESRMLCLDWAVFAREASRGVMSEDEMRAELQEFYNEATSIPLANDLAQATEDALAAITQRDQGAFTTGIEAINGACNDVYDEIDEFRDRNDS